MYTDNVATCIVLIFLHYLHSLRKKKTIRIQTREGTLVLFSVRGKYRVNLGKSSTSLFVSFFKGFHSSYYHFLSFQFD